MHKTFIGAVGLDACGRHGCKILSLVLLFILSFFFPPAFEVQPHLYVCMRACVRPGLQMLDVSLPVMMHQHVDNFFKQVRLLWAKEAASDLVNGLFQLRQPVVVLFSVVSERDRGEKKIKIKYTHHWRQKHMPVPVAAACSRVGSSQRLNESASRFAQQVLPL